MKDIIIIMCPPYPEYLVLPVDHSASTLRDCPKCKSQMWLSDKKKGVIHLAAGLGKEILIACYDCIMKHPEDFSGRANDIIPIHL